MLAVRMELQFSVARFVVHAGPKVASSPNWAHDYGMVVAR
jgi:hypothetical protein